MIEVEQATWLSPSTLVLGGAVASGDGEAPSAMAESRNGAASMVLLGREAVLVVVLSELQASLAQGGTLELRRGELVSQFDRRALSRLLTDPQSFARRRLAKLEAVDRQRVIEFLARTTEDVPERERPELSERLFGAREALRERLPSYLRAHVSSDDQSVGLELDQVLAVDDRSFYLEGRLRDPGSAVIGLTAVSPEGARAELLEPMYGYLRDGDGVRVEHGFHCFIELDAPSVLPDGWLLELETSHGELLEVAGPPVTRDPIAVRDTILRDPRYDRLPDEQLMANHVHPAISRIQGRVAEPKVRRVVQFGEPPAAPTVSIVVPLYEQIEHLEMQLSEFVSDPEIMASDLIYVLDSPERGDDLLDAASQLTPLYPVPFRVAVLEQNVGFAGANNAGAALAGARLLLLLNSDVLPDKPGWLSRMRDFHDSVPNIGALGAKLLYEDDSIQHAGMHFFQPPGSGVWMDAHYYKGMHRSLPAANVARQVPVVSGACMMIDRALYEELGGMRGIYVRGDYEDSDLCLQLSERGRENWYVPEVELYHLEGQSYSAGPDQPTERYIANRYNMWLHTHIWRERIEAIMREADAGVRAGLGT